MYGSGGSSPATCWPVSKPNYTESAGQVLVTNDYVELGPCMSGVEKLPHLLRIISYITFMLEATQVLLLSYAI